MFMFTPEQIAAIRKALGLSVAEFAKMLDVVRNAVYFWESGQRHPRFETLVRLNDLAKRASVSLPS